jgi:hypothetical protein
MCDGDGVTGNRVQVIYARASNVPDRYATYLPSFQQWIAGVDAIFNESAAQTGGSRHVRFVHDANCTPVILNVTLSPSGDDNFANTINELEAMGYSRGDRKYLIFMDARVYCGIGLIAYDDQPGSYNANNYGDTFGRIDAGCWSDVIPAHELMHQLGGVQMTAPHSSKDWHCYDGWDDMCRPTNGTPLQVLCTYPGAGNLFDCNHDDYYSTNPPAGSYLAAHWNAADSIFLFTPTVHVDTITPGKLIGGTFNPTTIFYQGETVQVRIRVLDQNGNSAPNTSVSFTINQPNGSTQCNLSAQTDSDGVAQGSCLLPATAPAGTWSAQVANLSKSGYEARAPSASVGINFTVNSLYRFALPLITIGK